ncbi:MAG: hypothetical protein A3G38_00385 [Omnitrophica WOR_2 bacterium RIFCSPLOWO2_12_FULL_51_8]|nr:MAG: hypothetical protein A3G38_00385 [Omnitrophica WOR_2 bacterium RIFCSPLOWO2_12_FULL_51_8]
MLRDLQLILVHLYQPTVKVTAPAVVQAHRNLGAVSLAGRQAQDMEEKAGRAEEGFLEALPMVQQLRRKKWGAVLKDETQELMAAGQ